MEYQYQIANEPVRVIVPERDGDLDAFLRWAEDADRHGPVALDTETTGLDIYSAEYRLRTVQFGDARCGWVIHWERGGRFREAALTALRNVRRFLIHNAPFDWCVLDRHAGVSIESLAPRTTDTRILAGLIDPRQPQEGGRGTGLKPLSAHYVDPSAPDTQGDLTAVFRKLKLTKETGWAGIPIGHPTYNLYAGLDVILTSRLYPKLCEELDRLEVRPVLVEYEHRLARMCAIMQRTGMVLDRPYTERLSEQLREDSERYSNIARRYGVENVNATRQIADALIGMGEELTETTKTGAVRVDKAVLLRLADLDSKWRRLNRRKPNALADAIIRSKRAAKWRTAYTDTFLETADEEGRVHPFINSMQARTGRMSITRPALQTLPSKESMIRKCMLADEGHRIVACDFQAIEMRVLAALADVRRMKEAIRDGEDLHGFTARAVFGDNYTDEERGVCKGVGFGKVYGGGASTIARQTGAPLDAVQRAMQLYDRIYPEITRASRRWQREALETGMVHVSVTGRRLPLDRDRRYAVVNYAVQSAARDVLGQSLIHMEEAGLLPYLRLPVHDEVIVSAPEADAADVAREVERCMSWELYGVPIVAEARVGGRAWGSLYE